MEIPAPGPLAGVRVVELAGQGPAPFAAMGLGDLGAEVLRVGRTAERDVDPPADLVLRRSRRSVAVDLKQSEGSAVVRRLATRADVLVEGFRPGVAERLGVGPAACLQVNPALVYGRVTGWGQEGPYASSAGHDINYIATTGALRAIGRRCGHPAPPLNLLGDYGGGAMLLLVGGLRGLLEARRSGGGPVIGHRTGDGV